MLGLNYLRQLSCRWIQKKKWKTNQNENVIQTSTGGNLWEQQPEKGQDASWLRNQISGRGCFFRPEVCLFLSVRMSAGSRGGLWYSALSGKQRYFTGGKEMRREGDTCSSSPLLSSIAPSWWYKCSVLPRDLISQGLLANMSLFGPVKSIKPAADSLEEIIFDTLFLNLWAIQQQGDVVLLVNNGNGSRLVAHYKLALTH